MSRLRQDTCQAPAPTREGSDPIEIAGIRTRLTPLPRTLHAPAEIRCRARTYAAVKIVQLLPHSP